MPVITNHIRACWQAVELAAKSDRLLGVEALLLVGFGARINFRLETVTLIQIEQSD